MNREYLISDSISETLKISANKVLSYKKVANTVRTVRVYQNGYIGVFGGDSNESLDELEKKAIEKLVNKIEYPGNIPGKLKKSVSRSEIKFRENFIDDTKLLLKKLQTKCKNFIVDGRVSKHTVTLKYQNTLDRDLEYACSYIIVSFSIRDKKSANIMDTSFGYVSDKYDIKNIIKDIYQEYLVFYKEVEIEEKDYKIITSADLPLISFLCESFDADNYHSGYSKYSGKLNTLIANKNLSIYSSHNDKEEIGTPFFDDLGEIATKLKSELITNGILVGVLSDRKTAKKYNLPYFKDTSSGINSVPYASFSSLCLTKTHKSLDDIIGSEDAIYISMASGGTTNADGVFSSPVQLAYLVREGVIIGKLSNINVQASASSLLNENYHGTSINKFSISDKKASTSVFTMKVFK